MVAHSSECPRKLLKNYRWSQPHPVCSNLMGLYGLWQLETQLRSDFCSRVPAAFWCPYFDLANRNMICQEGECSMGFVEGSVFLLKLILQNELA